MPLQVLAYSDHTLSGVTQIHRHPPAQLGPGVDVGTHGVEASAHGLEQAVAGAEHGQLEEQPLDFSTHPYCGAQYHTHPVVQPAPGAAVVVVQLGPPVVVEPVQLGGVWSVPNAPHAVVAHESLEEAGGQKVGAKHEQPVTQVEDDFDQVCEVWL